MTRSCPEGSLAGVMLPHVVIIGGGFAGLHAARALRGAPVRVTLLDRRNHHLFFPLLYQVATAGLNPGDIAEPIRRVLRRQRNAVVLLAEVRGIDPGARTVRLDDGELPYDYLILAAGSVSNYFGHEAWAPHAPGLLSLDDALEVRRRVLLAYEKAERSAARGGDAPRLTFVVIGGGPTGVELAGAIAEMSRHALARDFRRIDPGRSRVILLEGADRLLTAMPAGLSARAARALERLGVQVRTGAKVTSLDGEGVWLGEERIRAAAVFWAAGVTASPLAGSLGVPLDRAGRVAVEPDLSLPGRPEIFVAGDMAAVRHGAGQVPALAPAAMQQGRHAARNIILSLNRLPRRPFAYRDRGTLATIGRAAAVADFGRLKLSGYPAWLAWLGIHIFFLIGFRNRFLVLFQWAWAYVTYDRGSRLVLGGSGRGGAGAGAGARS
ncbi:MAG TPA: NAD(P)/FAD-dependent oxidoreductase [Candidatus Polarisedimenticolia bacterium]|nr:NAD(P)/FAD-dependent oxidoreductase [Candidatus Polarisedimenticolia bacterium]